MAPEHDHNHVMTTECNETGCGAKHSTEFHHSHEHGDDIHGHRVEGVKVIKLPDELEEIETEIDKNPTGRSKPAWMEALDQN